MRGVLRAGWERQGDAILSELLVELKELGLDEVAPIEEPHYLIREPAEARRSRPGHKKAREVGDDGVIVELFPAWLRSAEVCAQIRFLLKAHGYFLEADEYQYLEMVCQRHLLHRNPLSHFHEWLLKDLMFSPFSPSGPNPPAAGRRAGTFHPRRRSPGR